MFLDAECAWWGDPAFDLAFCLNHLLLKCLWTPAATAAFLAAFEALAAAYLDAVDWEPREAIERRAAALLPGLLLARVDGKSPVEYIDDDADRERVRRVAGALLRRPVARLGDVAGAWRTKWRHDEHGARRQPPQRRRRARRRRPAAGADADCRIRTVRARRVWDSRGRPTVEAEIALAGGAVGRAIVPAGASKGSREAHELRDGGAAFGGLDVMHAVANVDGEIARAVAGLRADDQAALDARLIELDGTPTKSRLGANATLAVSMAAAHAAAAARRVPLHDYLGGATRR